MSWIGNIANSAKKNILGTNPSPNQMIEERYIRQPAPMQGVNNNNSLAYNDEDENGVMDSLETHPPKQKRPRLKPFSFKNPTKDYNQSFDRKGKYLVTATYPLPPLSHQKKMLERNKKLRNKDNKFF